MFEFWSKRQSVFSLWLLLLLFNCLVQQSEAFVVPQELPSLLSLVYSNIPPIKKGTDSRLGFGFRLGEHADFQVIVELGPQKNTRPLGDTDEQTLNKRQATQSELHLLQRQLWKEQIRQKQEEYLSSTERTAATWLQSWSQDMNAPPASPKPSPKPSHTKLTKTKPQSSFKIAQTPKPPLPTEPNMEAQAMAQLQQLYKMATSTTMAPSTSTSSTTTPAPFKGGPLNLGGPSGFKLQSPALSQDSNLLTIGESNTKTKSEITKELMDVSLEDEAATP